MQKELLQKLMEIFAAPISAYFQFEEKFCNVTLWNADFEAIVHGFSGEFLGMQPLNLLNNWLKPASILPFLFGVAFMSETSVIDGLNGEA